MYDLISRQAAIEALEDAGMTNYLATGDFYGIINALTVIKNMPTAEPRKGKWMCEIRHYKDTAGEFDYQYIYCSECGEQRRIGWQDANYCPNCGARMEES